MSKNTAEYLIVLTIKEGMAAPSIERIGAAMEVGTDGAPEDMGFDAIEQMVVVEPYADLSEALQRCQAQCNAYGARAEQFVDLVRGFMGLEITCAVGPEGVSVNHPDLWYDAYSALGHEAHAALNTAPPPRFMVQWENAALAEFYELRDITDANAEGDPELCEWARNAKVGESHITGGGAAPMVTTWRIS